MYELDEAVLASITVPEPPDLVLIDGPSRGRAWRVRCSVTSAAVSEARDDGAARRCAPRQRASRRTAVARRTVLIVEGIHLIGKGLLIGRIPERLAP